MVRTLIGMVTLPLLSSKDICAYVRACARACARVCMHECEVEYGQVDAPRETDFASTLTSFDLSAY